MRCVRGLVAVVVCVWWALPALGDGVLCRGRARVAELPITGLREIQIVGDLAVATSSSLTGGFHLIDVSQPEHPELLSTSLAGVAGSSFSVQDDVLYFSSASFGIWVFDISDPLAPKQTHYVSRSTLGLDIVTYMVVQGPVAYIADRVGDTISAIDLSDPLNPVTLGSIGVLDVDHITLDNDLLYVVHGDFNGRWVRLIDVSDPSTPTDLGSFAYATDIPRATSVSGDFVYVPTSFGLDILDASNPAAPALIGSLDLPGSGQRVALRGSRAYVTSRAHGVHVVDVPLPSEPVLSDTYALPDGAWGVQIQGGYAVVGCDLAGLQVLDLAAPHTDPLVGVVETNGITTKLELGDGYALVAKGTFATELIDVYDISVPSGPLLIGALSASEPTIPGDPVWSMDLVNDLAVLCLRSSIRQTVITVDLTDPAQPLFLGSFTSDALNFPRGVSIDGTHAYIADEVAMLVLDIQDPANPVLVGMAPLTKGGAITVQDGVAYVADRTEGLVLFDVSDPTKPAPLDLVPYSSAQDIVVDGDLAVASTGGGLMLLDASDPTDVLLLSEFNYPQFPRGIAIRGNTVWLAGNDLIAAVDVRDPLAPVFLGSEPTLDFTSAVRVQGDLAYSVDWSGMMVFDTTDCPPPCQADLSGDGVLDEIDQFFAIGYIFFLDDPLGDFNADGQTNMFDMLEFLNQFDTGCP